MIRVLRVLVPEVIIAPLWASYVAMANALVAVGWRSDAVGPLACMGVIAPVTLPVWVFLSFTDDSVRWAYSGGRAWAIAG